MMLSPADLHALARWDTPTICNALELVVPERRLTGFTVEQMVCVDPTLPPLVGYARTAHSRTMSEPDEEIAERRMAYHDCVAQPPGPTVDLIARREAVILEQARSAVLDIARLREATERARRLR